MPATAEEFVPASTAELARFLAANAGESRQAVVPAGGRTALRMGEPVGGTVRLISTSAMQKVIDYPARDMTITVEGKVADIPAHLIAKFPDEMTIVLQNRFWDLSVEEDHFRVGLSFNQTPSMLTIPYAAITAFVDPSVDFGLQFQVSDDEAAQPEPHDEADNDRPDVTSEDGSNVVTVDFGKKR